MKRDLSRYGLIYVATPYSKYPEGIEAAFVEASKAAAKLMKDGARAVFSPIAHSHPIAKHGGIDPLDHSIWMPLDHAMMKAADALAIVRLPTWQESKGIREEIETFVAAGKPIFHVNWAES